MNKKLLIGFVFLIGLISLSSVHALITDGLVTYMDMDETTGNYLIDGTGKSLGANVTSGTSIVNGFIGKGRNFTASTDFIKANSTLNYMSNTLSDGTCINLWAYTRNNDQYDNYWFFGGISGSGSVQLIYDHSVNSKLNLLTSNASNIGINYTYPTVNQWTMITSCFKNGNLSLYYNGTLVTSSSSGTAQWNYRTFNSSMCLGCQDTVSRAINGVLDEFGMWNRTLSSGEIMDMFTNYSIGRTPLYTSSYTNSITLSSQTPTNLTATSLFNQNLELNFTYLNESTNLNLSSIKLNYSITGSRACLSYINSSCVLFNGTVQNVSPNSNVTSGNTTNASWTLRENQVYSYTALANKTFFNQTHVNHTLVATSDYIATKLLNVSNTTQYNILELNTRATTSNVGRLYACNSTFNPLVNTNPSTVSYCMEIGSINVNTCNHTHNAFDCDNNFAFSIINGRLNNQIIVTDELWIVQRGNVGGNVNVGYVAQSTLSNSVYTTTNNGNAWTDRSATRTVDTHLHQYSNTEYVNYYALGMFNGTIIQSSTVNELIDVPQLNPSPPIITVPFETTQATRYLNITYLNATITSPGVTISYYNITLLNNDFTFNRTIQGNNSLNNSYNWDIYAQNLSIDQYYIRVTAYTNLGSTSSDEEWFNLTRNALLNITTYNYTGSQLANFNVTVDGVLYSTSTSNVTLDVVLSQSYSISWVNMSYAYSYLTKNITSYITSANTTLYPKNSLNLSIKDSITQSFITQNMTIVVTNSLTNTFYTSTGSILLLNLEVGDNEIKIYNANYSEARYIVNVVDYSYNNLTVWLSLGSAVANVTFTIYNTNGAIVENAYMSQYVLTNSSYLLTMDGYSDISGKVYFSYNPLYYYSYNISHPDYVPYSFVLQPPKADNYDITLTDIAGSIVYSSLNITGSHTFNNVSKIINFSYVSGESSLLYEFWVYNKGVRVCYNTSLLTSNSFSCNVSNYEGVVYIYGVTDNIMFYGATETLKSTSLSDFISVTEASFWSGIIFLVIAISGAAWGIVISIILSIVAVAVILWLGLFSALSITILAVLIVMGLVIALVVRRAR